MINSRNTQKIKDQQKSAFPKIWNYPFKAAVSKTANLKHTKYDNVISFQYNNTVHLSHLITFCLSAALFKYHTSPKLPGWVICPHGLSQSLCCHYWKWWLHPHEPQDIQFPQRKLHCWIAHISQPPNVSVWRYCATSNSPASQASLAERWGS